MLSKTVVLGSHIIMALVVSSDIDVEAQRVIEASDHFAVLKLEPSKCTLEDVLNSCTEINAILRRREAIRNPKAAKARTRVDEAKAALGTESQLKAEKGKHRTVFVSTTIPPEQAAILSLILNTTEMLERRADAIPQRE